MAKVNILKLLSGNDFLLNKYNQQLSKKYSRIVFTLLKDLNHLSPSLLPLWVHSKV